MYKNKILSHIVACGKNGEIGGNNTLLWSLSHDLRHFKENTLGNVLLMGRKTVESLPRPLERRIVYAVSRPKEEDDNTLEDYFDHAEWDSDVLNTKEIFIAGGGQLYKATEDIVDKLYITEIDAEFPDADTFYTPPIDFEMVEATEWMEGIDRLTGNTLRYRFTIWYPLQF